MKRERYLNPGGGWVSPLCHEPRVALAVLQAMLAPHVSSSRVKILLEHRAIAAETSPTDRIAAVTLEDLRSGRQETVSAQYFLDIAPLCHHPAHIQAEIKLASAHNSDLGYPASVQLDDGSIWTVYYQCERQGEKPCLMGTHWRLKD